MSDAEQVDGGKHSSTAGDVHTGGGDFIGRDKNVGGDEIHGDRYTGDKITFSGNFEGAIVNVKSTLTGVSQQISTIPQADDVTKAKLTRLVSRLEEALTEVPTEKREEAAAIAQLTRNLVAATAAERPNKTMIQINGAGLQQAARHLAPSTPDLLALATEIVATVTAISSQD